MKIVVDAHKAIGKDLKGFGSQAKIHTRNNVGASGKIYFGTKQGYPGQEREERGLPRRLPDGLRPQDRQDEGLPHSRCRTRASTASRPTRSRGVAYISTCSDGRPGPGENSHFLVLDLKTGKYRDLIDTQHVYGFIVVDYLARAYHPMLGGDIVRYDPKTDKLERLKQTIDGKPPTTESNLADAGAATRSTGTSRPTARRSTALPMSTNQLYAYDLTADGRHAGGPQPRHAGRRGRRAPIAGRCASGRRASVGGGHRASVEGDPACCTWSATVPATSRTTTVRSRSRTPTTRRFTDKAGKPLPFHGGFSKSLDGVTTTKYVLLGVCQAHDGDVYILALHPYRCCGSGRKC